VRIDLHVHLSPYSSSSDFTVSEYCEAIEKSRLRAITVTDYATIDGAAEVEKRLGGVLVVYGREVVTHEGQFLVYSSERKFLSGLPARMPSIAEIQRSDRVAIVWAHPRMPWRNGWRAPFPRQPLTKFVFKHVDAVEYYNGVMLAMASRGVVDPGYQEQLRDQLTRWKVAAVGGSGCQTAAAFLTAWTVFPALRNTQDFITAIKDRAVTPGAVINKPRLSVLRTAAQAAGS
jgi:hypothetical protein